MAIHDERDVITISEALDDYRQPEFFIQSCNRVIHEREYRDVIVQVGELGRIFPNAAVPIAAITHYHRSQGVQFHFPELEGPRYSFLRPVVASSDRVGIEPDVLSRVWQFDEHSAGPLVERLVRTILERIQVSRGVADALNWSLWEVMDNVLQHSQADYGFIEAQVHRQQQRLVVCVADAGIGILESLRTSRPQLRTDLDAITLSMQERVTRDPEIGQGNGLWGLYRIASLNEGTLRITSGTATVFVRGGEPSVAGKSRPISTDQAGTTVDFQLPTSREIDISGALGHVPVNTVLESFESEAGDVRIAVREVAQGTGTRRSAEAVRMTVINLLRSSGAPVTLDFEGVGLISSSFADELVAKLVSELGFTAFHGAVRLTNLNEVSRRLIDRSVALRLAPDHGVVTTG